MEHEVEDGKPEMNCLLAYRKAAYYAPGYSRSHRVKEMSQLTVQL